MEYIKADVEKVCRSLLDDYVTYIDGDYSDSHYECNHCDGKTGPYAYYDEIENLKHELDCPILVARALLTGSNPKGKEAVA